MSTHAADHAHAPDSGDEHEHVHPPSFYVKIWAILTVLFAISVAGPMLGVKIVTILTAFGIAIAKAYLVCAYFMHLNIQRRWVVYLELAVLGMVLLFWFGVAPDVMKHEGQNWENVAAKQAVERGMAAHAAGAAHADAPAAPH
ncbi:MAG: cytochrome C oxidase subunit IV family protein [Deltaproteobacteria bacterium]|nr:cytochrome C oxidase subunit IV family protein [Deltaproteobacteria bacterium]